MLNGGIPNIWGQRMTLKQLGELRKQGSHPANVLLSLIGDIKSNSIVIPVLKTDNDFRALIGLSVVIFTNKPGLRFAVDLADKILSIVWLKELTINNVTNDVGVRVIYNGEKDIRFGGYF